MKPTGTAGEYILEVSKASPPITVASATLAGISLNEWVLIATLVYTLLQIGWFIYDKIKKAREG